ncbi:peptide ABC transporter substrate-binding protein [Fundicoccus culcitae]|uniref:Peptide ABC transporter substrate-binding protein n=1 Tax=Fundicoccus culcitae TaxID=2969821 RepID=A0ABY5P4P5_9LACT|nr:peptide ABC transporter substrate-binding protein [Fundicoccus culcitae]UUX33713.1 peptide ABC transporter substrate-binding protein [Fundicoccus culcitae]
MKFNFKKLVQGVLAATMLVSATLPLASVSAQDENVLRVQFDVEIASLDPNIATDGTSMEVIASIQEGLVSRDINGDYVGAAAESYDVNDEETVYTFHLRPDAVWSNGSPVTAHDFVFSWQRLGNPETAAEYSFILDTAGIVNAAAVAAGEVDPSELGVVAVDDYTLEVTLDRATPYFLSLMAFTPFFPINQEFFESTDGQFATSPETTISNGAFTLSSYTPAGATTEVVKNDTYYDPEAISLDGIRFQVIKDSQQAVLAYQTDQLDITNISGEQVMLFAQDPEFQSVQQGYMWFLSPNGEQEDFANQDFRLAFGKAFSREVITENVLKDGSMPATFFVPQGLANAPDGSDYRDFAGRDLMVSNEEEAKAHLEAAKEALGKDTFVVQLLVEDTEASINVAQSLEAQIESVLEGVDIQIEQTPKKNRLDRMRAGEFDVALTRWGPDYADPSTYLQLLTTDSNYNDSRYSNETFDADYVEIQTGELTTDPEARFAKMAEMEALALSEGAVLPVYQAGSAVLMKGNVSDILFYAVGTPRLFKYASKQ